MRFLAYFLLPVPLAVIGLLVGASVAVLQPPPLDSLFLVVPFGLIAGYVSMGIQSAVFATAMLWLERRRVAATTRYVVASGLGGLLGATLGFVVEPVPMSIAAFSLLGVSIGPVTVMLVDLGTSAPNAKWRRAGPRLLAAIIVPCGCGTVGRLAQECWVDAARRSVLSSVSIGMTYDDVTRVAGAPDHDSRKVAFTLPTESVDVVWMYDRLDPGAADALVVSISFKDEKVVGIRRAPISRD